MRNVVVSIIHSMYTEYFADCQVYIVGAKVGIITKLQESITTEKWISSTQI
jgi:hypothetical protein